MTLFSLRKHYPAVRNTFTHSQLQRSLNNFFDGFWDMPLQRWDLDTAAREFVPSMDLKEGRDSYQIQVEIPGINKEDVELQLKDNVLTIQGEKKAEQKEEKDGWFRSERSFGSFLRTLQFPVEVDEERVNAKYENGVLKITVAKAQDIERKTRKISIN